MWLDLGVLGILVAAALVGAVRGTLVSSVRLFGAVAAYAGAWWLGPQAGELLAERFGIGGTLGLLAGGLAVFSGLLLAIELLAAVVKGVDRRRRDGFPRGSADRLGGALVSAAAGFGFAILIGWLAITVDALRLHTGNAALPSTEGSRFAPIARSAVRGVGEWALSGRGPTGAAVARAVSEPAETFVRMQSLLENPHLLDLREDRVFWEHVERGEYERAVSRSSYLALAYDGTTRRNFAELGLIDEAAAGSSAAFRDMSVEALAAIGPRLRAVREDPALERLASDPTIQEMVLSNDTLGLLRHPDVQQVIARALSDPSAESPEPGATAQGGV